MTGHLPLESGELPEELLGPADEGWHAAALGAPRGCSGVKPAAAAYGRGSEVPVAAPRPQAAASAAAARASIMHVLGASQVWAQLRRHLWRHHRSAL